jgi:hypothetical protein
MIWTLSPADDFRSSAARFCVPPDVELARVLARRLREVLHRLELGIDVGGEHQVERADGRDGGELLHRIERQRLVDGGADRGAVGDEPERVAVGRLGEHGARRRDAARPGLIFHHETLPELVAELLGGQPRRDVGDPRGGERQDETHGAAGITLLRSRDCGQQSSAGSRRSEPRRKLPSRDAVPDHIRLSSSSSYFNPLLRRGGMKHAGARRTTPPARGGGP